MSASSEFLDLLFLEGVQHFCRVNVKLGGINLIPDPQSVKELTDPRNPTVLMVCCIVPLAYRSELIYSVLGSGRRCVYPESSALRMLIVVHSIRLLARTVARPSLLWSGTSTQMQPNTLPVCLPPFLHLIAYR